MKVEVGMRKGHNQPNKLNELNKPVDITYEVSVRQPAARIQHRVSSIEHLFSSNRLHFVMRFDTAYQVLNIIQILINY